MSRVTRMNASCHVCPQNRPCGEVRRLAIALMGNLAGKSPVAKNALMNLGAMGMYALQNTATHSL